MNIKCEMFLTFGTNCNDFKLLKIKKKVSKRIPFLSSYFAMECTKTKRKKETSNDLLLDFFKIILCPIRGLGSVFYFSWKSFDSLDRHADRTWRGTDEKWLKDPTVWYNGEWCLRWIIKEKKGESNETCLMKCEW